MNSDAARQQANKQLSLDFLAAMGTGDHAWFERHLAPDFVWIHPQHPDYSPVCGSHDRTQFIALSRGLLARMPQGLRVELRGMTAEGDRVAVEAESFGQTAAGEYNNRYHFLFQFRAGLIVLGKEYSDSAYMHAFSQKLRSHAAGK
jgi:ketosteroid isomerase-like protein